MPRMDGIDFLSKLMRLRPMPVVMVSTLTERGADVTLKALELGPLTLWPSQDWRGRRPASAIRGRHHRQDSRGVEARISRLHVAGPASTGSATPGRTCGEALGW